MRYRCFSVMFRNEKVADVRLGGFGDTRIRTYTDVLYRQPFRCTGKNNYLLVQEFLESRCYEDGRADLGDILRGAGLECNDPWRWAELTHGVTYDDFFWIRFPGENITWEEVKIRD